MTLDAAGNVLAADEYSSAITAYAPTDNGDDAPAYSISGSNTGLDFPDGVDVDAAGNIYVSNLPAARVAHRYRARLIATFGIGRYHWAIRRGHLPRGLRLDTRTGRLTGTPAQRGTFHIRVKVTDRSHSGNGATESLTLIVKLA